MYAIMEVGGKQVSVKKGDVIEVEKQDAADGASVKFDKVLLIGGEKTAIGTPYVANAVVEATVKAQTKGPKLVSFKYRRRKSSHTTRGHRQKLTRLVIEDIKF
ncbi:MAG: 50S ribosomal protein L21 [Deltaproteobacteria bacterium]